MNKIIKMLLISALALGLVESTSPNAGASLGNYGMTSNSGGDSVVAAIPSGQSAGGTTLMHSVSSNSGGSGSGSGSGGGGSGSGGGSGTIIWDTNGTYKSAGPNNWPIEQCLKWQRPHHLYYQLGNAFFFLAFMAPHGPYGMLWLRSVLLIGCVLMAMWGWLIECNPDIVLWSGLFLAVNFIYLIILLCRLRPVRFDKEIEAVSTFLLYFFLTVYYIHTYILIVKINNIHTMTPYIRIIMYDTYYCL